MSKAYIYKVCLLGLALLGLASCERRSQNTDRLISMSVLVEHTKAGLIEDNAGFQRQGNFGVFGYKAMNNTVDASSQLIFNNQLVENENKDTDPLQAAVWTYSPLRYWDTRKGQWYNYIAYAPHNSTGGVTAQASMTRQGSGSDMYYSLTLSNIPAWQPAATGIDYLVSDVSRATGVDYVKNYASCVDLTFNHILALVDLAAYKIDGTEFTIEKVQAGSLSDADRMVPTGNDNSYEQAVVFGGSPAALQAPQLSLGSAKGQASWYQEAAADGGVEVLSSDMNNPTLICQMLAFPFSTTGGLNLNITFKRGAPSATVASEVAQDKLITSLSKLESGKHYSIVLKFEGGLVVDVHVSEVQDWIIRDRNHSLYNW